MHGDVSSYTIWSARWPDGNGAPLTGLGDASHLLAPPLGTGASWPRPSREQSQAGDTAVRRGLRLAVTVPSQRLRSRAWQRERSVVMVDECPAVAAAGTSTTRLVSRGQSSRSQGGPHRPEDQQQPGISVGTSFAPKGRPRPGGGRASHPVARGTSRDGVVGGAPARHGVIRRRQRAGDEPPCKWSLCSLAVGGVRASRSSEVFPCRNSATGPTVASWASVD
jgi:hypothetical protein